MPIDIDFGALQHANPFAAYQQGQEIGAKRRQDQATREAGNIFATDPEKAAQILMSSGDLRGGLELQKYGREAAAETARRGALTKVAGGDLAGGKADALNAGDVETYNAIATMTKEQRAQAKANNEDLGGYAQTLLSQVQAGRMTPQDAKAHILQDKPHLMELGLTPEVIDSFDPTPENLQMLVSKGMDLKAALEQADKDRNFGLHRDQFNESRRHNKAAEGVAARNASTSAYSAQTGRMSYDARKAAGGFGTPGMSTGFVPDEDVDVH